MQSKAMEDFRKNDINSSNFVLQLPANYGQTDQELNGNQMLQKAILITNTLRLVQIDGLFSFVLCDSSPLSVTVQRKFSEVIQRDCVFHPLCSDFCFQLRL